MRAAHWHGVRRLPASHACATNAAARAEHSTPARRRSLQLVLKDNLGDNWEEACITLMSEMRMFELECLRRRMEDKDGSLLHSMNQGWA